MATTYAAPAGREMTVGSVLGRAFGAIGAAPAVFLGIGFVFVALPGVLVGAVSRGAMRPMTPGVNPFAAIWPALLGGGFAWWVLYLAAQALLFRVAVAALDNRPLPLGSQVAAAARTLPRLFGLSIVLTVAVSIASLFFFVPGVILMTIWSVAAPALVLERVGVFASLGRSSRLTHGARPRVFGLFVLVIAIYYIAAGIVGVGSIAANGVAGAMAANASPSIAMTIVSAALQTAFMAVFSAVQATLYVELRDWKDGFGGDKLAEIFA